MTRPLWGCGLVVAKAPVPGEVKTRLAVDVGATASAELAAAALLDTLAVMESAFGARRCHLSLTGDLSRAASSEQILPYLDRWHLHRQRGAGLGARLADAHQEAASHHDGEGPVVQVGMDTPQVTVDLLAEVVRAAAGADAVVGPAADGGWWVLALRDPSLARVLVGVPMSTSDTGAATVAALEDAGARVHRAPILRDVDTVTDARAVAESHPASRFGLAWRHLGVPR